MQATSIAAGGIASATRALDASARRVATIGAPEGAEVNPVQEAVVRINMTQSLAANLAVIRAADKAEGTLLDMKA